MNPIKQINNVRGEVKDLLEKYPRLRDSDSSLVANIWNKQLKSKGINVFNITAAKMLEMFAAGEMINFETVRRCRQKLQELHPELRGESYNKRQADGEEVRKQIANE